MRCSACGAGRAKASAPQHLENPNTTPKENSSDWWSPALYRATQHAVPKQRLYPNKSQAARRHTHRIGTLTGGSLI